MIAFYLVVTCRKTLLVGIAMSKYRWETTDESQRPSDYELQRREQMCSLGSEAGECVSLHSVQITYLPLPVQITPTTSC